MSDKVLTHQHMLENGDIIKHAHIQEHTHKDAHYAEEHLYNEEDKYEHTHLPSQHIHTHTHENTKAVLNRLSKVIGHLESIKRMVESGRDCSEVLVQLAAVKSAINSTGKVILKDHIEHCIVDAVREQDMEVLEELNKAIDRFMK